MAQTGDPTYRAYIEALFVLKELHRIAREETGLTPHLYDQLAAARQAVWRARRAWHEKCRRAEHVS